MIDHSRFPESPLSSHEVSDDELRTFAVEALSRLIAQNIYDALIAATDRVLDTLHSEGGNAAFATAIRESRSSTMQLLIQEIEDFVFSGAMSGSVRPECAAAFVERCLRENAAARARARERAAAMQGSDRSFSNGQPPVR